MSDKIKFGKYFVPEGSVLFQILTIRRQRLTVFCCCGFTLVELIVVMAILGVLATMSIPVYSSYSKTVKNNICISDLRTIDKVIQAYVIDKNALPSSLSDVGMDNQTDPWKRHYQYQNLSLVPVPLEDIARLPLNLDYDLYSAGEDGLSDPTAGVSGNEDDIVRSNGGAYIGGRP